MPFLSGFRAGKLQFQRVLQRFFLCVTYPWKSDRSMGFKFWQRDESAEIRAAMIAERFSRRKLPICGHMWMFGFPVKCNF